MTAGNGPLVGVYPGTFDPVTKGHLAIIVRAAKVLDRLIIALARSEGKGPVFSTDERLEMVGQEAAALPRFRAEIEVKAFDKLLIHFCHEVGATVLVRGLRAVSDFEYEFQMAAMNARQDNEVETVFFMASERHQFISSHFVKEVGRLGGDISTLVSANVERRLLERFGRLKEGNPG